MEIHRHYLRNSDMNLWAQAFRCGAMHGIAPTGYWVRFEEASLPFEKALSTMT